MNKNYFLLLILAFLCACQSVPPPPENIGLADITVEKISGRPYIWANLNGKRYQFLLDTGSTGFLLTEKMAKEAGLTYSKNNTMKAHGITGVINLKTVDKISLVLDNRVVLNVSNVAVVDKDGFGLFPYEFFEVLDIVWDVKNSKLIFKKDNPQTAIPNAPTQTKTPTT
jgi:predicted aspartyl protease